MHLSKYTILAALLLVLVPSVLSQQKLKPKTSLIGKKFKPQPVTSEPEPEVDNSEEEVASKHQNMGPVKTAPRANSVSAFLQKRKKERLESTTEFNPQADLLNKFMAKAAIVIDTTQSEVPSTASPKISEVKSKSKSQVVSSLKRSPRKHEAVTTASSISRDSSATNERQNRRQNLERRFRRIRKE